jgi:hypothetical protein
MRAEVQTYNPNAYRRLSAVPVAAGAAIMLAILPHVPFWSIGLGATMVHPLFSLELLIAAGLMGFHFRLGLAVMLMCWTADAIEAASLIYHFASPLKLIESARYVPVMDVWHLIAWRPVLVFASAMLIVVLALRRMARQRRAVVGLVGIVALLGAVDMLNGSTRLLPFGQERLASQVNVLGAPVANVIISSWRSVSAASLPPVRIDGPVPTYDALRDGLSAAQEQGFSVLVVLVESLGLPRDPRLQERLRRSMEDARLQGRWAITYRPEPFRGSTTYGELRVLCRLRGDYATLTNAAADDCLPRLAARQGFTASGLHGFGYRMFDRQDWWPRAGLRPWTAPDVTDSTPHGCNEVFVGLCDAPLLAEAARLADEPRQFVYALTLDTHLPLASAGAMPDAALAEDCKAARVGDAACVMMARLTRTLTTISEALASMKRPPMVVIVGDHAPPFLQANNRDAFDQERVPAWILRPGARSEAVGKR